jgi:hypothetical protein
MMVGNLNIEQRKWILKQYWKTENAERVRTAWVEAFNTPPPTRLTIYRIRDKSEATGSVANAPKSGRPRTSMTEETEMRVAMTFVNSPVQPCTALTEMESFYCAVRTLNGARRGKRRNFKFFKGLITI